MLTTERLTELSAAMRDITREAGTAIMEIYHASGGIEYDKKSDDSPVTKADEEGEKIILARLKDIAPDIPVVAEESVAAGHIPDIDGGVFFLVDPLDGTKEFISRNGEFTVNIALIKDGLPLLGTVYAPAKGWLFDTEAPMQARQHFEDGTSKKITVRPAPETLTAVASRSHRDPATDEWLGQFNIGDLKSAGSSLKLCLIAAGEADLYPRLGRTMEWDIAAGHAVLRAAGGTVLKLDGSPFTYGKPGFENPHFVAKGDSAISISAD